MKSPRVNSGKRDRQAEEATRLLQQERRAARELEALLQVSAEVASTLNVQDLTDSILRLCLDVTDAQYGFLAFLNQEGSLEIASMQGMSQEALHLGQQKPGFNMLNGLHGWVFQNKQPIRSNKPASDPRGSRLPPWHPPLTSLLGVPLLHRNEAIGLIAVANSPDGFTEMDERLLSAFAHQAATALRHAQLHQQATEAAERMAAIGEIISAISSSLEVEEMYPAFSTQLRKLVDADRISISLIEDSGDTFRTFLATSLEPAVLDTRQPHPMDNSYTGWVAATGSPLIIEDRAQEKRFWADDLYLKAGLRSSIHLPLRSKGRIFGALNLYNKRPHAYGPREEEILQHLARPMAIAIENARLYQATREALEKLKELERLKTEVLSSVSHELRAPLAAIKGFASSLLQSDVRWDAKTQRGFIQIIDQEADRLTQMVTDLLDMSRIEAGMLRLEKSWHQFSDIVEGMAGRLSTLTENHTLQLDIPPGLPPLFVDEGRIQQVISNLVSNAAKYSPEGSRITIAAQPRSGDLLLSVADEGQGIAPEHLERVFDRFYQVKSGLTRLKPGAGLGLAICRGLVEIHGGRIWVESSPGQGATFYFSLPLGDDGEADNEDTGR
jgi:K+-sensing histidine kinase KdpD